MEKLLDVVDLTVRYGDGGNGGTPAVLGATFSIHAGEAVGMLGESGCGKTTTALALLRLLPDTADITSGSVLFRGRNLLEIDAREMREKRGAEISLIFQEPSIALNPVMCVGDQVAEVVRAHRTWGRRRCRQEAEHWLAQVLLSEVPGIYEAYPHELSGGQKQRVLIAQALACSPALVIADEPTTGLDAQTQSEILDLLRQLKANSAFLFISHDPAVLAALADRLLVMYAGKIVEEGVLAAIYRNPVHPYTRGLLGSLPETSRVFGVAREQRFMPIDGAPPDMNELPRGCSFSPRCPARVDLCSEREPALRDTQNGHRVSCHVA